LLVEVRSCFRSILQSPDVALARRAVGRQSRTVLAILIVLDGIRLIQRCPLRVRRVRDERQADRELHLRSPPLRHNLVYTYSEANDASAVYLHLSV